MLLNIYLGTTAASWVTMFIFGAACERKIRRDGYKFVNQNESFIEMLACFISIIFKCSIPVYNIINTIIALCMGDDVYEYVEAGLLEKGKIYKPNDESMEKQSEVDSFQFEKEQNKTDSIQKVYEKKYDDMSVEEKLTYLEREILLRQGANIMDENLSENFSQEGPILKRTFNSKKNN